MKRVSDLGSKSKGITLIELLMGVAVLGLLIAIGVPQYNSLVVGKQVQIAANDLISGFSLGRAKAAALNGDVIICAKNAGGTACGAATAPWSNGWFVFLDVNGNNNFNSGETIFENHGGFDNQISVESISGAGTLANKVEFNELGHADIAGLIGLNICDKAKRTTKAVRVALTVVGRGSVTNTAGTSGCTK